MPRSAAKERGKENKFLKWRSMRKAVSLYYAKGDERKAWLHLRKLMILTNRSLSRIKEDKRTIEKKDDYRE